MPTPVAVRLGASARLSGLLLGAALLSQAAAQSSPPGSDPFLRSAPAQVVPQMLPLLTPPPANSAPVAEPAPGQTAPASPGSGLPQLSAPRAYSESNQTRVVFDLPAGASYSLIPTAAGMQLEFDGVQAAASLSPALGNSVSAYRVTPRPGGANLNLSTPFALGLSQGWRASETTIVSGGRVLILEFGPAVAGGASSSVRGGVQVAQVSVPQVSVPEVPLPEVPVSQGSVSQGSAPQYSGPATPMTTAAPPADPTLADPAPGDSGVMDSVGSSPAQPPVTQPPVTPRQPVAADQLAPGDNVTPQSGAALPAPAADLPGLKDSAPTVLTGKVPGRAQPGAVLAPPRIGKNPGVTRIVLDLPPGTSFVLSPGALGLSIELSGAAANTQSVSNVSAELRGWRYASGGNTAGGDHTSVFLLSASALSLHSGWRGVLLPPPPGSDRSRLAIDFSPAFANTTAPTPAERVLAAVPMVKSAALNFSGNPVMVPPSVVIDPGHGGRDPGAVGVVTEKVVVLDVALRVRRYLEAAGVNVIMTRSTDQALNADKATDLNARAALGLSGAQLFLSIHANSMEPANVLRGYGIETWWNKNNPGSPTFAGLLQKDVIQETGAFSQGLKNSRSLAVLRGSKVPAALIEIGFVGHPVDGGNLQDNNYLERVALGIARAVREALVTGVGSNVVSK